MHASTTLNSTHPPCVIHRPHATHATSQLTEGCFWSFPVAHQELIYSLSLAVRKDCDAIERKGRSRPPTNRRRSARALLSSAPSCHQATIDLRVCAVRLFGKVNTKTLHHTNRDTRGKRATVDAYPLLQSLRRRHTFVGCARRAHRSTFSSSSATRATFSASAASARRHWDGITQFSFC